MNICILTPRFPFPENGGDVLRINNVARYLKQQGHTLILVSFVSGKPDLKTAYQLYDKIYTVQHHKLTAFFMSFVYMLMGRPLQCGYYHSSRFRCMLNRVIATERPHRYIAHLLRMTPYLDDNQLVPNSIIEMTDALSRTYALSTKSALHSPMQWVYRVENNLIRRYEDYVARRFRKIVLVSQSDIDLLRDRTQADSFAFHTNGVSANSNPLSIYNPHKICFVGNMRTLQNQEAVLYFVEEVLPLIMRQDPRVVFYIIGAQPSQQIIDLANNPHIVVTNYVDSVEAVLSDACVTVAPVHIAAGIQNKVLIAMGQRIPVVMTPLIAQAIPELKDNTNCLIRDGRQQIAEACLSLMTNSDLRNQIAQAGYDIVRADYDWNVRLNGYEKL